MINKTAIESPTTTMKDDNQGVLMKLPEPYNIPTCTYITYHYKNSNTTVTGNSSSNHPPPLRSSMKKSDSNSNNVSVVQFIPQCQNQIEYTISIDDMTNDEICNTWIQEEEEEAIRRRVQKIVAYANRNGIKMKTKSTSTSSNKQLCLRGLESHTKIGSRIRQMNRIIASEKVFVEQDNQWNKSSGIYYNNDVHKIAFEYTTIYMECQRRAEQIAIQDRIAIEQYIQNEIKLR